MMPQPLGSGASAIRPIPPLPCDAMPPRLSRSWILRQAEKYPLAVDKEIAPLAGRARPRYDEVLRVVRWKAARSSGYFLRNDPAVVEARVREALDANDPLEALDILTRMHGVKERMASAILAAFRPDRYTVMDWRAWEALRSLGHLSEAEPRSWRKRWVPYLEACRALAVRFDVDLRTLDRALWEAGS